LWGVKLYDKVHPRVLKIQGVNKCDAKIQTLERLHLQSAEQTRTVLPSMVAKLALNIDDFLGLKSNKP
jgi:hypothetical protein